jgi:hypothetical protein
MRDGQQAPPGRPFPNRAYAQGRCEERFPNSPVTQSSLTARPSLRRGQYGPAIIGCPVALLSLPFHSLLTASKPDS